MTKDEAITTLVQLFDEHKLTFRNIKLLREVFDEAVLACDEQRSENEANYHMGRSAMPSLPSRNVEDDFYDAMESRAQQRLKKAGVAASGKALAAVTEFAIELAEFTPRDFYLID